MNRLIISKKNNTQYDSLNFFLQFVCFLNKSTYLCTRLTAIRIDSLAQLVEHNTFNVGVLGSSPKRITKEGLQQ